MRWRRRTDDARRTKGDPPPTYAQLTAQLREAKAMAADFLEQCANLRGQVDGLIVENARLRAGRTWPPGPIQLWMCPVEGHTKVEWRNNVGYCPCGRTSADVDHSAVIAPELGVDTTEPNPGGQDPDPSRGYIADWEARYAKTGDVGEIPAEHYPWPQYSYEATYGPVPEAGKDETR